MHAIDRIVLTSSYPPTHQQGLIHPLSPEIFSSPRKYLQWYLAKTQEDPAHAMAPATAPRVALLLYRKHYITNQVG